MGTTNTPGDLVSPAEKCRGWQVTRTKSGAKIHCNSQGSVRSLCGERAFPLRNLRGAKPENFCACCYAPAGVSVAFAIRDAFRALTTVALGGAQ